MAEVTKILVKIGADTYELTKGLDRAKKETSKFGNAIKKIGGLIAGAFAVSTIINFTKESSKLAGEAEGIRKAYNKLDNTTIEALRESVQGTVSDMELMRNTVMAATLGLDQSRMPELFAFAAKRANETGQEVQYLVDSIVITKGTNLVGVGSHSVLSGSSTTNILGNKHDAPVIVVRPTTGADFKGSIKRLLVRNLHANGVNADGISIDGEINFVVEDVFCYANPGYGIRLGRSTHTTNITIDKSQFSYNGLGGIYGIKNYTAIQLNGITIKDCYFGHNGGDGINVWGTNLIIRDNILEANDSSAIAFDAYGLQENTMVRNCLIEGNYIEQNGRGAIFAWTGYDGTYAHFIEQLTIRNNMFYEDSAVAGGPDSPRCTGMLTFDRETGSTATWYFRDLKIYENKHVRSTDPGFSFIDGNNIINYNTEIHLPYNAFDSEENCVNLGTSQRYYQGKRLQNIVEYTDSHILVLGDDYVQMNAAGANNLTVPPNSSVAFAIGTAITVEQTGAGVTTFAEGSGVTINSNGSAKAMVAAFSPATLIKTAINTWTLTGNLE